MTDTETPATARYAWTHNVPVDMLGDERLMRALQDRAFTAARADGHEPLHGDVDVAVAELGEATVALMARIDTGPGSEWYGLPAEVIEAEVAARESAARRLRVVRVEFDVAAADEKLALRELKPWAADEVMRQALENDQARRDDTTVCGIPANRHDFLPRVAELLRDGRVQSATCQKCRRDVPRAELLENAAAEARGDRWWEQ